MKYWTCRKRYDGIACCRVNPNRKRTCSFCGAPKPKKRKPKHMVALELPYEKYVELNGGEHCAICGRKPSANRKLDRDHCHKTAEPRGLLCHRCNRALADWLTPKWLEAAANYLERAA